MGIRANIFTVVKNFASPVAIAISIFTSVAAIYFAYDGTKASNKIAMQALETARQANEIALGRVREPSILQFSDFREKYQFDFTSVSDLERELNLYVDLNNDGKKAIEGAVFDVVGVESLTYNLDDPSIILRNLPSVNIAMTFNVAVQPGGTIRLDVRRLVLQYLEKLVLQVPDKSAKYVTSINLKITAKGLGESIAVGAPIKLSPRDRHLLNITFKANVIDSKIAKKILADPYSPQRIFSP